MERDRGDRDLAETEGEGRCSHVSSTRVARVDDSSVFHVDPRPELVAEAEPVGSSEGLEVVDVVGQRIVVMSDAHVDRDSKRPGHGL